MSAYSPDRARRYDLSKTVVAVIRLSSLSCCSCGSTRGRRPPCPRSARLRLRPMAASTPAAGENRAVARAVGERQQDRHGNGRRRRHVVDSRPMSPPVITGLSPAPSTPVGEPVNESPPINVSWVRAPAAAAVPPTVLPAAAAPRAVPPTAAPTGASTAAPTAVPTAALAATAAPPTRSSTAAPAGATTTVPAATARPAATSSAAAPVAVARIDLPGLARWPAALTGKSGCLVRRSKYGPMAARLGAVTVGSDGRSSYAGQLRAGDYQVTARTVDASGKTVNESPAAAVRVAQAATSGPAPAAATPAPARTAMGGQVYIVQSDDWLSKIALKFYGDMTLFPRIVAATNARAEQADVCPHHDRRFHRARRKAVDS